MRVVTLSEPDDFDGWRDGVRAAVLDNVRPDRIVWRVGADPGELFGVAPPAPAPAAAAPGG